MSDQISEESVRRLKELAELRDAGVLNDEEFQRAKARLLGAEPSRTGRGTAAGAAWSPRTRWLILGGVGVLLFALLWLIFANQRAEESVGVEIIDNGMLVDETAASGAELCAAADTHRQLKDVIFDKAVDQYDGPPAALNSLRRAVGIRMQYPLMTDENREIQRTECSGRLTIDLPPTTREEFRGDSALEADLDFALQPSVDGKTVVVDASGFDVIVQRLVAAAGLVSAAQAAQAGADLEKTYNPGFDCSGEISDAERIICRDEELSELDRRLTARYARLKEELAAAEWASVEESRRQSLQRRAQCDNAACILTVYGQQSRYLDGIDDAGPAEPDPS